MRRSDRLIPTAVLLALASLLLLERASGAAIPCSETMSPPAVSSQLDAYIDIELSADTTHDEVVGALGPGIRFGPSREMVIYLFGDGDGPNLELWLSFEPSGSRRLTRALLRYQDGSYCMSFHTVTLLNELAVTRNRRRDQLDFSRRLSAADVYAAWGPPDGESGSGLQRWHYRLANGEEATLFYDGAYVVGSGQRRRRSR